MEQIFRDWLADPGSPILRISGEGGAGKSTLASWLFLDLAERAPLTPADRIPVQQSFDSLFGFVKNAEARDPIPTSATWSAAEDGFGMNTVVVFIDGHDAPLPEFDLVSLSVVGAKIIILQSEMTFADQPVLVSSSTRVAPGGRVTAARLRSFSREEMREVISRYFPIAVELYATVTAPTGWKEARMASLLSGDFDELLLKPQMAHRLCRIAADQSVELKQSDMPGHWTFRSFRVARTS